jgi:hypothetical protein
MRNNYKPILVQYKINKHFKILISKYATLTRFKYATLLHNIVFTYVISKQNKLNMSDDEIS